MLSIFAKIFNLSCQGRHTLPTRISTECFEKLVSSISKGDKMLHFVYFFVFSCNTHDKGLNLLLLQLKWLE